MARQAGDGGCQHGVTLANYIGSGAEQHGTRALRQETDFERILPVDGAQNLRDMGGYHTTDGRMVKWRTLYRSGVMARLAPEGAESIRQLGIVAICDLRANDERERNPTQWHEGTETRYHSRDYEISLGELDKMVRSGELRTADVSQMIQAAYKELPFEQAQSYRKLFGLLAGGELPLLFNCTAGKDRTGIAAALILFALGVSRETIEQDYELTDHAIDRLLTILVSDPRYSKLQSTPKEVFLPLLRADPAYLALAFSEIERKSGGMFPYLEEVLGVGEREIAAMREHLLV